MPIAQPQAHSAYGTEEPYTYNSTFRRRQRKQSSNGAAWLLGCGLLGGSMVIGLIVLALLASVSVENNEDIQLVKTGSLAIHPGIAMGAVIDSFLRNPQWTSGGSPSGQRFVNVSGDLTFQGKKVNGMIQFLITGNEFEVGAFEINGVPQNNLMKLGLLAKMYENFEQSQ